MFTDVNGLSNEQIRAAAPAVFAEGKHESRSARYGFIPTITVIDALRKAGFVPTAIMAAKAKVRERQPFTKHLMRLRRVEELGSSQSDVREVVIVNSHDGSSAYDLYSGVFRIVCSNGLITGDIDTRMKVYHTKRAVENVIEGSFKIIEDGERVMEEIAEMKQLTLSRPEQLLLAESALSLRFPEVEDEDGRIHKTVYEPEDLLRIRRSADSASDLYTTFNVIQENALAGGLTKRDRRRKRHTTRAINGIDQNVRLNQELWRLTQKMAELKRG